MAVGSVVNAIAILRHLAVSEPQGVNAIARSIAISPSTCFNILKTLVDEDFVEFDPRKKIYRLGSSPSRIFSTTPRMIEWTGWLREKLEGLASDCSLTSGLWELRSNRVVLIEVAETPHETRIHLSLGQRLPSHIGAMGRCIMAREQLSFEEIKKRITALTWQSAPTAETYIRELQAVKKRGWAIDEGNYIRGVTTLAAPILDQRDQVLYCITSTVFSGQYDAAGLKNIGERTAALAAEAERKLSK
jgi:DNA-binding IclR family transcriptional regulator